MDRERAERLAAKRNARLRERHPLFADRLPQYTAEQVMREFEGYDRRRAEGEARLAEGAAVFRAQVQELVAPEEFTALEERRKILPPSVEYDADFWQRHLRRLTEGRAP
jgi:hypothetical protein